MWDLAKRGGFHQSLCLFDFVFRLFTQIVKIVLKAPTIVQNEI